MLAAGDAKARHLLCFLDSNLNTRSARKKFTSTVGCFGGALPETKRWQFGRIWQPTDEVQSENLGALRARTSPLSPSLLLLVIFFACSPGSRAAWAFAPMGALPPLPGHVWLGIPSGPWRRSAYFSMAGPGNNPVQVFAT
jgi:hypothetical protein